MDVGKREYLFTAGMNTNKYKHFGNKYAAFQKAENRFNTWASYTLVYPKDSVSYYKDICLSMFTAALVTTVKKGNSSEVHKLKNAWLKYGLFPQQTANKKNEIMKLSSKCKELETIILSEGTQYQK